MRSSRGARSIANPGGRRQMTDRSHSAAQSFPNQSKQRGVRPGAAGSRCRTSRGHRPQQRILNHGSSRRQPSGQLRSARVHRRVWVGLGTFCSVAPRPEAHPDQCDDVRLVLRLVNPDVAARAPAFSKPRRRVSPRTRTQHEHVRAPTRRELSASEAWRSSFATRCP